MTSVLAKMLIYRYYKLSSLKETVQTSFISQQLFSSNGIVKVVFLLQKLQYSFQRAKVGLWLILYHRAAQIGLSKGMYPSLYPFSTA